MKTCKLMDQLKIQRQLIIQKDGTKRKQYHKVNIFQYNYIKYLFEVFILNLTTTIVRLVYEHIHIITN